MASKIGARKNENIFGAADSVQIAHEKKTFSFAHTGFSYLPHFSQAIHLWGQKPKTKPTSTSTDKTKTPQTNKQNYLPPPPKNQPTPLCKTITNPHISNFNLTMHGNEKTATLWIVWGQIYYTEQNSGNQDDSIY